MQSATSLEERLTRFVRAYAGYLFDHPHLARILSREMLSGGLGPLSEAVASCADREP